MLLDYKTGIFGYLLTMFFVVFVFKALFARKSVFSLDPIPSLTYK